MSALACSRLTPGFKRASAWRSKLIPRNAVAASSCIGSNKAGSDRRNLNDAGSTPMMTPAVPSILQRLADHVLGATEAALPVAVGQDHPQRAAWRGVFCVDQAAEMGLHPQERQGRVGHGQCLDLLRIPPSRDRHLIGVPGADRLECLLVVAIGEIRGRTLVHGLQVRSGPAMEQAHQSLWIMKGQWLQQHAVDHAENRRRGADPERQRQDGGRGEARLLSECPCGVAEVLPDDH